MADQAYEPRLKTEYKARIRAKRLAILGR